MNTTRLLITSFTVLLLGMGNVAFAATPSGDSTATMPNASGMMQDGNTPRMGHMMRGGMMGMMGGCPMMGAEGGPNGKVMMQMHGEMMRSMGEIMMKYADKLEAPSSSTSK
ncbi:hypothetical protein [Castellaniella sp. S9]|uniref:hypothetical protein n=1 Tax=Castellaniella sp. S9 TaxID=2993652 RepID=UPI0022B4BF07|nr:hypothetical protein [Castellaniella sp. S9]